MLNSNDNRIVLTSEDISNEFKAIRYKETYPTPNPNEIPTEVTHSLLLLSDDMPLTNSYEPVEEGSTRKLFYGIDASSLSPKQPAESCPNYSEQIVLFTGEKYSDTIVASSVPVISHSFGNLTRNTINLKNKTLTQGIALPNPFGKQRFDNSDHTFNLIDVPSNRLSLKKFTHKDVEITLIFGEYDFEKSNHPELAKVSKVIGIYKNGDEKLFITGNGESDKWTLSAYKHDRRYNENVVKKVFTLEKINGVWSLNTYYS